MICAAPCGAGKEQIMKKISFILALFLALTLTFTGCSDSNTDRSQGDGTSQRTESQNTQNQDSRPNNTNSETGEDTNSGENPNRTTELEVCFGDDGAPFILHTTTIQRQRSPAMWVQPIGDSRFITMTITITGKSCSITTFLQDMRFLPTLKP